MSGFIYFLPQVTAAQATRDGRFVPQVLAQLGLAGVLDDCTAIPDQCVAIDSQTGPGDTPGLLLYPQPVEGQLPPLLGYLPDSQTWRPVPRSGPPEPPPPQPRPLAPAESESCPPAYWIGWHAADPPRPADLERREQIAGYRIPDAYDDGWLIPVARAVTNPRGNLPWAVRWSADDKPSCGVSARYAEYWTLAGQLADLIDLKAQTVPGGIVLLGAGTTAAEDDFLLHMVIYALGINYRVDRHVLAAYESLRPGWLSQVAASLMANAIVDLRARQAWEAQKKTASLAAVAGTSSPPGSPAAIPTSVPRAAN